MSVFALKSTVKPRTGVRLLMTDHSQWQVIRECARTQRGMFQENRLESFHVFPDTGGRQGQASDPQPHSLKVSQWPELH